MTRITLTLFAALSLDLAAQGSPGAPPFAPAALLDVGARSGEIVLADVNGDRHLDLVLTHYPSQTMSVRLGDGAGRFTLLADGPMPLPNGGGAIVLGDVNGDSHLDVIVASRDERREYVSVMAGDGRGRFHSAPSSPYAVGDAFAYYKPVVRLLDVNEDGRADIVSANGRRNGIEILFGDGRGAFTMGPRVELDGTGDFFTSALADLDGDGHLDIVAANSHGSSSDRVVVKRGDGRGRFGSAIRVASTTPGPRVAALADVNGDRRVDIVLAHMETALLTVLLNAGKDAFAPASSSPYRLANEAWEVVVTDVDRDGRSDLVTAAVDGRRAPYNGGIAVLLGRDGGFAPAAGSPYRGQPGGYNLAVGDVNEDGRADVAASSFESESVTLLLGQ